MARKRANPLAKLRGFYSFVSLYLNHRSEEPVAKFSRLAQGTSPDDKESLVLLSGVEPIYSQIPLFYSDRAIQQTYTSSEPVSEDAKRYVSYENLSTASLRHVLSIATKWGRKR